MAGERPPGLKPLLAVGTWDLSMPRRPSLQDGCKASPPCTAVRVKCPGEGHVPGTGRAWRQAGPRSTQTLQPSSGHWVHECLPARYPERGASRGCEVPSEGTTGDLS